MSKLTIIRGISGSGKSTWARQQNGVVISRDDYRHNLLFPDIPSEEYYKADKETFSRRENMITVMTEGAIANLLKSGFDVIVDNTNVEWKYVKAFAKIGYRYGADVEVKVFDVPLTVACDRDFHRAQAGGRGVGHEVITKQYDRFKHTKSMILEPVAPVKPYNGTPGKPKAFLVDIDGTLAHMRDYRKPYQWDKVHLDDVDEVIADIVNSLKETNACDYEVIVMSGRDESCREQTEAWLDKHGIWYDELFMRPEGDMRPDNIIKAELFDTHVRDNFDVQFVLDDRDQVVEMWRRMGLTCLQVAPGDF